MKLVGRTTIVAASAVAAVGVATPARCAVAFPEWAGRKAIDKGGRVSTRSFGRLATAAVGASAALALIAGCGGSSKSASSATPTTPTAPTTSAATTSSAAPSSPDPTAQAKSDALAAYQKVIDITTREFATNQEQPDLLTYAKSNAYLFFRQVLVYRQNHYIAYIGTPQSSPTVTKIDIATTPQSATITDCYGGPNYKPVFASDVAGHKKGDSALVAGSTTAPHVVTAVMENKSGTWQMISYTATDQTC